MSASSWMHWRKLQPSEGDLVEINRTTYSHWAVYIGDGTNFEGKIMHFNPAGSEFQLKNVKAMDKFQPGEVTISDLGEIAGESLTRINNKEEVQGKRRSVDDIRGHRKILVGAPGFFYSLEFFNCEHFATFIKFDGISESGQMNVLKDWMAWFTGGLTNSAKKREALLKKVAYMQWEKNEYFAYRKKSPPHILQAFLNIWESKRSDEAKHEIFFYTLCDLR